MEDKLSTQYNEAVQQIKTAILRSQAKALSGVNQEQLALYYGIGRYVSYNTREGFWGKGAIATISAQLRAELPGIRGFSESNIKSMRTFYEEWRYLEANSPVTTDEICRFSDNCIFKHRFYSSFVRMPIGHLLSMSSRIITGRWASPHTKLKRS